jgi:hypothetical protein
MFITGNKVKIFLTRNQVSAQHAPALMSATSGLLGHRGDLKLLNIADTRPNKVQLDTTRTKACACNNHPCSCFCCEEISYA